MRQACDILLMKSILYLVRRKPGPIAEETIDMVLVSGVFGQPTSVLFIDDGVYQLLEQPGTNNRSDTARKWSALPTYEIDRIFIHERSVQERTLDCALTPEFASMITDTQVDALLHEAASVVSD
ncbi:MAG: DsrE family protein [Gammaproteobacteria bacterium]|nr:DsrE family protein [Gammaproteobacteria bacterium]